MGFEAQVQIAYACYIEGGIVIFDPRIFFRPGTTGMSIKIVRLFGPASAVLFGLELEVIGIIPVVFDKPIKVDSNA